MNKPAKITTANKSDDKPKRGRPVGSGKGITKQGKTLTMTPEKHEQLSQIVKAEELKTTGEWVAKQIDDYYEVTL